MVIQEDMIPSIFSKMRNGQVKKTGYGADYGA